MRALGISALLRGCLALALCGAGAAGAWGLAAGPVPAGHVAARRRRARVHWRPSPSIRCWRVSARPPCSWAARGCWGRRRSCSSCAPGRRLRAREPAGRPVRAGRGADLPRRRPRRGRRGARRRRRDDGGRPRARGPGHAAPRGAPGVASLTGLPLPDRAVGAGPATPTTRDGTVPRPRDGRGPARRLAVVDRGRAAAGPAPTDAEVTAAWHRLHGANRARVGPTRT